MRLNLDDLERRAEAAVASGGSVCWHDARSALALIRRVRRLEENLHAVVIGIVASPDDLDVRDPLDLMAMEALDLLAEGTVVQ